MKRMFFRKDRFYYAAVLSALFSVIFLFSWSYSTSEASIHSFSEWMLAYQIPLTQCFAFLLGMVCMYLLSHVGYHALFWAVSSLICWIMMFLTFIRQGPFGYSPGDTGAFCWINLPFGLAFQPSELIKVCFIVCFSYHLICLQKTRHKALLFCLLIIHLIFPVLIVHLQGDDGTALVLFITGIFMVLLHYHKPVHLCIATVFLSFLSVFAWKFILRGYQHNRILAVFAPDLLSDDTLDTFLFQQNQAVLAQETGGFSGQGLFQAFQISLPAGNNDFFFSYVAYAAGYLGCVLVCVLIFFLWTGIIRKGYSCTNMLDRTICFGVFSLFFTESILNIGMNLKLLPVIGVPLPFFSSGGSALLASFLCIGLVLAAGNNHTTTFK